MAARITLKSALEQLDALRHNLHIVETERDSLRTELDKLRAPRTNVRTRPSYATDEQRAAHDRYVATLMAAKDLAIRSGRSVRVGER